MYAAILTLLISIISLSLSAETKKENQNCLISSGTLKGIKETNNLLFVDVRSNQIFNEKHISGSINIPLQLMSTKAFLKNKNIVLVGSGWNEQSLIDQCRKLKSSGFKTVRVLAGGIITWFKNQNKLSKRSLISLNAKDFFNNNMGKKFVPYVVSTADNKIIKTVLPHAKIYSHKIIKTKLLKGMKRLGKGNNPIVIFSQYNPVVDAVINNYLKDSLRKVFYFEGGFEGYKKIHTLNKMTSLSNQSKRLSTKKPVSCAN